MEPRITARAGLTAHCGVACCRARRATFVARASVAVPDFVLDVCFEGRARGPKQGEQR